MTPEGKNLKKITDHLKAKGIPHIRLALQPMVTAGWPDLLVLMPGGRPMFIEVKAKDKEPTDLQYERMETLSEQGYIVGWVDNAESAIAQIDSTHAWAMAVAKVLAAAANGPQVTNISPKDTEPQ